MSFDDRPTAGVVVIGDEVLGALVEERNLAFVLGRLRALGVRCARVAIVPDEPAEIGATVVEQARRFDYVFTSGGVGPTHDDVTIDAIAAAFGRRVVESQELVRRMEGHLGRGLSEGHRRMARIPDGAELVPATGSGWPALRLGNVFILPGVPELMRAKFRAVERLLSGRRLWAGELFLAAHEAEICELLGELAAAHPNAHVGSYPEMGPSGWTLRLAVESVSEGAARGAFDALDDALGELVERRLPPALQPAPDEPTAGP